MTSFIEQFTGAYATPEIVGREGTLATITRLLQTKEDRPQVIYLHADGGYGKSRLLTKALELCRSIEGVEGAEHLIDLYHHQNHTPITLTDAIVSAFPGSGLFDSYRDARQHYMTASLADDIRKRDEAFKAVFAAFSSALAAIGPDERIVIALDTLERLVYTAKGVYASTATHAEYAEVWPWLHENIARWHRVTLLLAGRPESRVLIDELRASGAASVTGLPVEPFTPEESDAYFTAAEQVARAQGATLVADRIAALTPSHKEVATDLSKGIPVKLALIIDHLVLGDGEIGPLLEPGQQEHASFEAQFVGRLAASEAGELILMLGRLPKGADASMLASLLGWDKERVEQLLPAIRALSFVKVRQDDDRLFLHDEIYALLEKQLYSQPGDYQTGQGVLEAVIEYYDHLFAQNKDRLDHLFAPVESGSASRSTNSKGQLKLPEIVKAQAERRTLLTESLHYRLRASQDKGLKQYYRYMREAILSGDPVLDVQLQVELEQFLKTKREVFDPATERTVQGILTLRPVTREYASGHFEKAVEIAQQTLDQLPDRSGTDRLLTASLLIWSSYAAVYVGGEGYSQAYNQLQEALRILKTTLDDGNQNGFVRWRIQSLLALAYRVLGYLNRVQGRLTDAVSSYRQAINLWRDLDFDVELATTLNDLGFAEAQPGQERDARSLVLEAYELREKLTHRIPLALSLNTLGIISRRTGAYNAAIERSTRALMLGRALGSKRIEGLALVALAEAERRLALSAQTPSKKKKKQLLGKALKNARTARELFNDIQEQSRQVESWIEVGCALRDRLRANSLEDHEKKKLVQESRDAFMEAANIARNGLPTLHADALTNLAWLEFLADSQSESLISAISAAEESIEREWAAISQEGNEKTVSFLPVYVHRAKLSSLHGHLAMQRATTLQTSESDQEKEDELQDAISHFIDSFRYNLLINDRGEDFERLRNQIYAMLKPLDSQQLRVVCGYVRDQGDRPGAKAMQEFLQRRARWYD